MKRNYLPLQFVIHRSPISTNDMYGVGKGKRIYTKPEVKEFKEAVKQIAWIEAKKEGWPKPENVEQVYLSIIVYNTKHDCSAAEKLVADALEGVLYKNDKVAHPRFNDISNDGGVPRIEVEVELLKENSGK